MISLGQICREPSCFKSMPQHLLQASLPSPERPHRSGWAQPCWPTWRPELWATPLLSTPLSPLITKAPTIPLNTSWLIRLKGVLIKCFISTRCLLFCIWSLITDWNVFSRYKCFSRHQVNGGKISRERLKTTFGKWRHGEWEAWARRQWHPMTTALGLDLPSPTWTLARIETMLLYFPLSLSLSAYPDAGLWACLDR